MIKKIILTTAIAALLSSSLQASELNEKIDAVFAHIDDKLAPGCSVGVIKDGALAHQSGYGLANLELGVELDGSQVHRMGSVSKQFTAMSVLLLAEEGKIDLDEDIRTYLPTLIDYGTRVTINAMLGHFAGMGDYELIAGSWEGPKAESPIDLRSAAGGPFRLGNEDYLTIGEFYDVLKRLPLALKPDQEFRYSNLAYFLLSMLVEEVSGESLREYAGKRIFKPLGMNSTFFSDDPVEIVKNRASGYKKNPQGQYINDMTNLFWVGDGGLHTNVEDMARWDSNFYDPKVGKDPAQILSLMTTPNSDHSARSELYANGQFIGERLGRKNFHHSGGWLGTSTYYERIPQERLSVILMCNDADLEPEKYAEQILGMILH